MRITPSCCCGYGHLVSFRLYVPGWRESGGSCWQARHAAADGHRMPLWGLRVGGPAGASVVLTLSWRDVRPLAKRPEGTLLSVVFFVSCSFEVLVCASALLIAASLGGLVRAGVLRRSCISCCLVTYDPTLKSGLQLEPRRLAASIRRHGWYGRHQEACAQGAIQVRIISSFAVAKSVPHACQPGCQFMCNDVGTSQTGSPVTWASRSRDLYKHSKPAWLSTCVASDWAAVGQYG